VTGPREAVLKPRIHGGIKARESNIEEVRVLGMVSLRWEDPEAH
jgi:hypothetical protein